MTELKLVPRCGWPGCDHAGAVSLDGCKTGWCWCHVDVGPPTGESGEAGTCRRCAKVTTNWIDGEALHPLCWRPWRMARDLAELT